MEYPYSKKIKNRYGIEIEFIRVNDNNIVMIVPDRDDVIMRRGFVTSLEGHEITTFIDTSGGPFIQRGFTYPEIFGISEKKVISIQYINSGQYKGNYNIVIV
jgi:hypothetical protein